MVESQERTGMGLGRLKVCGVSSGRIRPTPGIGSNRSGFFLVSGFDGSMILENG